MMFDTRLPQPNGSFRWVQGAGGPALVCRALEPIASHLMTTRHWTRGVGAPGEERRAWEEISHAMGAPLVRVHQVHGTSVFVRRAGDAADGALPTADIVVSNHAAVAAAIQTADCVPLLLADRRTGAVAAAHAGWRGLAAGVPRTAVGALEREFGSRPEDLLAAAGPSIGACCYEVGADVRLRFTEAGFPQAMVDRWFLEQAQPTARNPSMRGVGTTPRRDHWYFDSARSTRDQLESAGVPPDQVFVVDLCTASHPGVLCSYRRDGAGAGRLAGVIRARGDRLQAGPRQAIG
jgi:YfiH family protein